MSGCPLYALRGDEMIQKFKPVNFIIQHHLAGKGGSRLRPHIWTF